MAAAPEGHDPEDCDTVAGVCRHQGLPSPPQPGSRRAGSGAEEVDKASLAIAGIVQQEMGTHTTGTQAG
jgi:hypothetical protein